MSLPWLYSLFKCSSPIAEAFPPSYLTFCSSVKFILSNGKGKEKYGKRLCGEYGQTILSTDLEKLRIVIDHMPRLGQKVQFVFRFWFNLSRPLQWNVMRQLHINLSWKNAFVFFLSYTTSSYRQNFIDQSV